MTPLGEKLVRLISATGPIPVSDYMAHCLFDPEHGYYTTREPFGAAGDFRRDDRTGRCAQVLAVCFAIDARKRETESLDRANDMAFNREFAFIGDLG